MLKDLHYYSPCDMTPDEIVQTINYAIKKKNSVYKDELLNVVSMIQKSFSLESSYADSSICMFDDCGHQIMLIGGSYTLTAYLQNGYGVFREYYLEQRDILRIFSENHIDNFGNIEYNI